jgi:hypothetical protein
LGVASDKRKLRAYDLAEAVLEEMRDGGGVSGE